MEATAPQIQNASVDAFIADLQRRVAERPDPAQRLPTLLDAAYDYADAERDDVFEGMFHVIAVAAEHATSRADGYGLVEVMPGVLARLFNGDTELLVDVALNPEFDEFSRSIAIGALTILTYQGRVDRSAMEHVLAVFPRTRPDVMAARLWGTWMSSIASLGYAELVPLVERTVMLDGVPEMIETVDAFRHMLAQTHVDPDSPFKSKRAHFPLFVSPAVSRTRFEKMRAAVAAVERPVNLVDHRHASVEPAFNENRSVGRNDPCPCGSGKKHKKCCLN